MAKPSRSTKMRRFLFTVDVKPEHLVSYKMHHDNIWKEVAGGLRQAGIKRLTTWQLQATNRLAMLIGVSGTVDLGAAVGPGSVYLGDPRCEEWESLMNSYFIGGDWTELVEIHSDDCEVSQRARRPQRGCRLLLFTLETFRIHTHPSSSSSSSSSSLASLAPFPFPSGMPRLGSPRPSQQSRRRSVRTLPSSRTS